MAMKIDDGGPAFPGQALNSEGLPMDEYIYGMSLRDKFAEAALIGMGTWVPEIHDGLDRIDARAEWAYRQADAMLRARKVSTEGGEE